MCAFANTAAGQDSNGMRVTVHVPDSVAHVTSPAPAVASALVLGAWMSNCSQFHTTPVTIGREWAPDQRHF